MTQEYLPPATWSSPKFSKPSHNYMGEESPAVLHEAVGRATSAWEHAESGTIKLFQVLCETKSLAACRAYGTIDSVFGRHLALKYAADEFFHTRELSDCKLTHSLVATYNETGQYRNEIAHGMAVYPHGFGYFVCAPSYSSRRRSTARPSEKWGLGSKYFYRVAEIDLFRERFEHILRAIISMTHYLNDKYTVLNPGDLHP